MKRERTIVFSNYDMTGFEEDARFCLECDGIENPDDGEITRLAYSIAKMEFQFVMAYLTDEIYKRKFIATGSFGLWDGRRSGWLVIENEYDFGGLLEDCTYVEIADNNGLIEIKASHHDGTNYFTLKELTDHGYETYKKTGEGWYAENYDLGKYLFENNFNSRIPRLSWEY